MRVMMWKRNYGYLLIPLCLLWLFPVSSRAQDLALVDELDFDDPEAWAMKFFTSASLLTSLGPVEERDAGSVELGVEVLSVPHLSAEERTVGFDGIKEEDLNRSPVGVRLRAAFGLPAGWSLVFGWVPPVEVDGVEANLFSAALERPLLKAGPWGLGLRLHAQVGESEGDFTCGEADAAIPPGAPGNEFGCEAPSNDEATLEYVGVELVGSYRWGGERAPDLHFGVGAQRLDLEFQVDALTFGFRDRTLLLADGWTYSATLGATWSLRERSRIGVELFYSPLEVDRLGQAPGENDPLFNVRALFRYRIR